jgi:hypothetical protein
MGSEREGASLVSLNHPLRATFCEAGEIMKKLQYLFMTLSALCLAVPAFADGGAAPINLVPIGAGIGMAIAAGLCGLGQGKATAFSCCWFWVWRSSSPSRCSRWSSSSPWSSRRAGNFGSHDSGILVQESRRTYS